MRITVKTNGAYHVEGGVPLSRSEIVPNELGESWDWREVERIETEDAYDLCRCGRSGAQPFCDDECTRTGFDGTETAKHIPYLTQAGRMSGPELDLTDAPRFCAFARFCDARGSIWNNVMQEGADAKALVERQAERCPSGRLVAWAGDGGRPAALEPNVEPSITLVEDPPQGVSGPVAVRGGIPVQAGDGRTYEVRNRVTLCRCGASRNKPFCDGSHSRVGFVDPSARAALERSAGRG
jgi:CDGSH-type Zn-finger protein